MAAKYECTCGMPTGLFHESDCQRVLDLQETAELEAYAAATAHQFN
jgi:hypothetical protein